MINELMSVAKVVTGYGLPVTTHESYTEAVYFTEAEIYSSSKKNKVISRAFEENTGKLFLKRELRNES